ncbi:MAG: uroporphyrinogen decarboxylase family protein [bacterium]
MAKKTVLTSKERVRLSLNWQEPDRVPIQVYLTPEMEQRLNRHFTRTAGVAASIQIEPGIMASSNEVVLRKLGVDFRGIWPAYRGQRQPPRDGLTFIEMGLDILDAMQPEPVGMDPETIRKLCRGKLAFCGLISTQQTLPYGSVEDCRREARHRLDVIAPGGGYIFSPAHCIQPDTPLENVLAIYEEALGHSLT